MIHFDKLHHAFLFSPNMANTVNAALKPLETLSRIVNQPSSLFGSKGASGKNKSEQDAHGAARDPNSNQPDTGTPLALHVLKNLQTF